MRWQLLVLFVVLQLSGEPLWAAQKQGAKSAPVDEQQLAMDQSLQEIFKQADRNHNNFLSKTEFKTAQEMLESNVAEWGQRGMLGKPQKKGGKKDKDPAQGDNQQAMALQAAGDKLAKSNKVNLSEFVNYAQNYVAGADDQFRAMKSMSDAQRKAYQNQRRNMPNRRRGRY